MHKDGKSLYESDDDRESRRLWTYDRNCVLPTPISTSPFSLSFSTQFLAGHIATQNKKLLFPASLAGKVVKTRFCPLRCKWKYCVGL